jgi:hypothetical protein
MNRLMSDIIKRKQLPQEEHQALKRIGKAICDHGCAISIRQLAIEYNVGNGEFENSYEIERLGWQLLKIIDKFNESTNELQSAHTFLMFLHRIALNVL